MNNVTRISYGGVGKCSFPRVRSGTGKSHWGLDLAETSSPLGQMEGSPWAPESCI